MRRVGLAAVLTLNLFAVPLAGEAQQPDKVYRIGMLREGALLQRG